MFQNISMIKRGIFQSPNTGGDTIGRVIILELQEDETDVFEQLLSLLQAHPEIKKIELDSEPILSLPGLEIYPEKRKVFRDRQEIHLTTKEYEILILLAANKGHVLTYSQIYEKV